MRDCVASLRETGLADSVQDWIGADKPFLGVCLGMQALFERSEEGDIAGLGIFRGAVKRFVLPAKYKIPHMGWNTVTPGKGSALFEGVEGERFYFVHSYALKKWEMDSHGPLPEPIVSWSHHGEDFVAAVENGPLTATQFHPEKSGLAGIQLLRNWVASLANS